MDENPIEDGIFDQNEIVIKKEDRGTPGSTEYCKNYTLITGAMEEKFGAVKHFAVSSCDGETDSGNTRYKNVQEQFVGNYTKLTVAEKHCVAYDLMGILDVPEYCNPEALHPSGRWGATTKNLLQHWSSLDLDHVTAWQRDTNRHGGATNRQTSQWLQTFLFNSCTAELRQCVNIHYDSLDLVEKGGVVYFYFILQEMF